MSLHTISKILLPRVVLSCCLVTVLSFAQPNGLVVSPNVGKVGTPVTITGTGFSSTASSNTVYFGAVKATVTSATTTSLSVTVPPGATFEPVSVTVGGLTGYSRAPFLITFDGVGGITTTSFAPKVEMPAAANLRQGTVADLDGDGRPDLAESSDNNAVAIYRNISSPGVLASSSFAGRVEFAVGMRPYQLQKGDLDGDGKLDLACANNSGGTITVLRNTSTVGLLSFARQDFSALGLPQNLALGDLDGDGKLDIAVTGTNSPNGVVILRNTSSVGSISFAAGIPLTTGQGCAGVAIADIDGDGRKDLVLIKREGTVGLLSVFRNLSTPGSIQFATGVDFTCGQWPQAVSIGDLDGDQKLDVVLTSGVDYSVPAKLVSLFRNSSVPGSISFSTRIDLTAGGAPWFVDLGDLDGDGKIDIAVPSTETSTVAVFRNLSSSGFLSFSPHVDFPTRSDPSSVNIVDLDLDGKPDLTAASFTGNGVSVLRNIALPEPLGVLVTIPDTTAIVGKTVEIPVYVGDLTGKNVLAYQFAVTFNSPNNILTASSDLVTTGTLSGATGWSALPNISVPNQITVGAFGASPLSGGGVLVKLKFTVNPATPTGQYSNLQFSNFLFNAGTPAASTTNGKITARLLVCGDADENGSVQAYDAALTLREAIGPMPPPPPPLTAQGRLNADVDMNGYVQAYDAALILRNVIGLSMPVGVSTCFSGITKAVALESGSVNFTISVASVQRDKSRTSAQLTFKGVTSDAGIVAISFDVAMAEAADNAISLIVSGLSEDYMHTINRVDNEHFKVGIINPRGITTDDIRMTIGATREESLKDIRITNILLNSTPAADIALTGTVATIIPSAYDLVGCYPNPFNPSTTIRYGIPADATVNLAVYNTLGQKVAQLVEEQMSAGYHDVLFDASQLASGIYYYRLEAADFVATKKLVLMR